MYNKFKSETMTKIHSIIIIDALSMLVGVYVGVVISMMFPISPSYQLSAVLPE